MHILKVNFTEDPNIGLRIFCNDTYSIIPMMTPEKLEAELHKVLKTKMVRTNMAGTTLNGAFIAGNNKKIMVPSIAFDKEVHILKEAGLDVEVFHTRLTALGNNMIVTDKGALVNPEYSDHELKAIKDFFQIEVKRWKISELETLGALARLNDKGCITTHDIKDFEAKFLETFFRTKITTSTVNFGSPYISSGLVCNRHGFVVGGLTSGPEIVNIDEGLGFI
jgi:translation initiation factor 6